MGQKGVLFINLGTPDSALPQSVRRYLKEFLNDPRVIDLPWPLRWVLVNCFIVPFRYRTSSKAYQKIWTAEGSPLLSNTRGLIEALAPLLGDDYRLSFGMRYGQPSIAQAFEELRTCESIIILPLFPQYASASTGSALEAVLREISRQQTIPNLKIIKDFFDNPGYIAALAAKVKQSLHAKPIEHFIFSFHGLPERQIDRESCSKNCSRLGPCPRPSMRNITCYRTQSYETARLLAENLNLGPEQYTVAFQSRLGRIPWIQPYLDNVLPDLIKKGIRNIAIASPSFVADCLETLEELAIRGREQWEALGGQAFVFVPCLNQDPLWLAALESMIRQA